MKPLKTAAIIVATTLLLLALLEGMASLTLLGAKAWRSSRPFAETIHTQPDAELGWVNLPNTKLDDMYGPGISLTINAQGFRGEMDTAPGPADGTLRMVCSGDSFTLGYGVADDETWCHLLQGQGRPVETVNMGQGGYGLDQAYLWYRNDGQDLNHQVHIFAFIRGDFRRLQSGTFSGYAKPKLRVVNGQLEVIPADLDSGGGTGAGPALRDLRLMELLRRVMWRFSSGEKKEPRMSADESEAVARAVLRAVGEMNRARGITTVFVYLPTQRDVQPGFWGIDGDFSTFRTHLRETIEAQGELFIDLTPALAAYEGPRQELFIQPGEVAHRGAAGHYSALGNRYMAESLWAALMKIDTIRARTAAVWGSEARDR